MAPVKLYVYDLSNGIARAMSRQLTGVQIDGIWHTSIVVFGQEVYYGQGVSICPPGGSHLGGPLEIHDLGETEIDQGTFTEFIDEMRGHYTAEKYHLLEFNCNSFTNDVAGFLTGGSIPAHIKDLPATFLSTPFGQSLRPMIDNMYRRPAAAYPTPASTPPSVGTTAGINSELASSLLRNVAVQAAAAGPSGSASAASLVSPLHISTNAASLESITTSHRNVVVLLSTGADKELEQIFEQVAKEQASKPGLAFVKVDTQVGTAQEIARKYGVASSRALLFFRAHLEVAQVEDLSTNGIRDKITTFINEVYPVHPHASSRVPAIMAVSTDPILYTQLPSPLDVPINKLINFIDSAPNHNSALDEAKSTLKSSFATYLKKRFPPDSSLSAIVGKSLVPISNAEVKKWTLMNTALLDSLAPECLFPLVDLWRLAILDSTVASKVGTSVIRAIVQKLAALLVSASSPSDVSRPLMVTTLRLCANSHAHPTSTDSVIQPEMKDILVSGLLHPDASVRTGAASLAFNVASRRHTPFRTADKAGTQTYNWGEVDRRGRNDEGGQDVELIVALLEAVDRETNEGVVHRLIASLAMLIYLSDQLLWPDSDLHGTLEVLAVKDKLNAKLVPGGCGPKGITKSDVRNLVAEVASLCP